MDRRSERIKRHLQPARIEGFLRLKYLSQRFGMGLIR
jgi:hypothetical protein